MAKKQSSIEKFVALSDEKKAAVVERAVVAPSKPLAAAAQAKWAKVQASLKSQHAKKRGRPATSNGAQVISLRMEKNLLKRADAFAKREGISRATLIAKSLAAVLG